MIEKDIENQFRYRVGIDVGLNSTGFCAVQMDDAGYPIKLLNSVVFVHDAGVDPGSQKSATTRLAVAGVKRRTRRMFRRRKNRLRDLDNWIVSQGWPLVNLEDEKDPYLPWLIRAELAQHPVDNPIELGRNLSIALRHMARHRGWRNPYAQVRTLYHQVDPSPQMVAFRERVGTLTGRETYDDETPAELVVKLQLNPLIKLRGPEGLLGGKLMQSDNANELRQIARTQGLSDDLVREMIDHVFQAQSPKGSALGRVGKDALPGQEHLLRATKASEAFQEFRIVTVVANLRVVDPGQGERRLTTDEQSSIIRYLMREVPVGERITWADVSAVIGIDRKHLKGTAAMGPDGERPSSFPPTNTTDMRIRQCKVKPIVNWWQSADSLSRSALINELANSGYEPESEEVLDEINSLIQTLSDVDIEKLSGLALPAGRGAYSEDSMRRLSAYMLETGADLTEARMAVFGVSSDWVPPADPIDMPVGNPAVDRVTKQVARWLRAVEQKWGTPESVNIEHVRNALGSVAAARKLDYENNRRYKRNLAIYDQMIEDMGNIGKGRRSDLNRYLAIQRQNSQCAYCGSPIGYTDAEMDHIVPRKGVGSTNTRNNLVATCRRCNHAKGKLPFAVWAAKASIPGVSVDEAIARVKHWNADAGMTAKDKKRFTSEVIARLTKTEEDPDIDNRSIESVAWMANELHLRIKHHYKNTGGETSVAVYQGLITAEARKASGFEGRVNLIGGRGKTRLDRRHHAMDALTIALVNPSIAKTLAERINLRNSERAVRSAETWKSFDGSSPAARAKYAHWLDEMMIASELFNLALSEDQIPIIQPLRLRLGNSAAHEDTIRPLVHKVLSGEFTAEEVDRASTPALWCALTRLADFDPKDGLPADPERSIVVNGHRLGPLVTVGIFGVKAASIAVRGGSAELGSAIHHARIYRVPGKSKPIYGMVRVYTVDLLKHQHEDLFSVELPPQSVSMRWTEKRIRDAIRNGTAEYINWITIGDELELDMSSFKTGQVGQFLEVFPEVSRWSIDGYFTESRLRLRPIALSAEGLANLDIGRIDEALLDSVTKILDRPGWSPAVSIVFHDAGAKVIRRTTLGAPRLIPDSGLPTGWTAER